MTGYGKARGEVNGRMLIIELRSLNSKQLDLNPRINNRYRNKEAEIRNEASRQLERGKIDLSIYFDNNSLAKATVINKNLAHLYLQELKELQKNIGGPEPDYLSLLLRLPDVLSGEESTEADEEEWKVVKKLMQQAFDSFNQFRSDEGKNLAEDLDQRIASIRDLLKQIAVLEPQRISAMKLRLQKSIEDWVGKEKLDENRLEQEMLYYVEKLDINEEKVRLLSHLDYFNQTMQQENAGRKLGFIGQEIGREINTIGSKANDAGIQRLVVLMKEELEKIKEQSLNVL